MKKPLFTTPQQWAAADRRIDIVLKRQSGWTFGQIGKELGIGAQRVNQLYRAAIKSRVARWRWLERMDVFNERLRTRDTR